MKTGEWRRRGYGGGLLCFMAVVFSLVGGVSEGVDCHYGLAGDVNGDCRTDLVDFALVAAGWLVDCDLVPEDPACVPLDLDEDGFDVTADCNDDDATVYPGAAEIANDEVDQDCDGSDLTAVSVEELLAGELVVNEVMQNPDAVFDAVGEWFEIYNASGKWIDLQGLEVFDLDGDRFFVTASVIVAPGGMAVLGNNADAATNGGVAVDWAYESSDFTLGNANDEIVLANIALIIEEVWYDDGVEFPDPTGRSMNLDPDFLNAVDNDEGVNWCATPFDFAFELPGGDRATPGLPNAQCE